MATLHLPIGLPCSGKTTLARQLEEQHNALRLTPDEWHLPLFGDDADDPQHDEKHSTVEAIMWTVAARILTLGVDVVLDFGLWAREERTEFRKRAAALGADVQFYYMDVPWEELLARLEARNQIAGDHVFHISTDNMELYRSLFQAPTLEEMAEDGWNHFH